MSDVDFGRNFAWQDRYWPRFEDVIIRFGASRLRVLNRKGTQADLQRMTDADLECTTDKGHFSLRVHGASSGMRGRITIRWALPSGHPTEAHKLLDGHGNFILQGVGNDDPDGEWLPSEALRLGSSVVVCCDALRRYLRGWRAEHGEWPGVLRTARGGNQFRLYRVEWPQLRPGVLWHDGFLDPPVPMQGSLI